jgi:phospholipid/cholesterol/gamma-HCH transport system permease protein
LAYVAPTPFQLAREGDSLRLSGDLTLRDAGCLWTAVRRVTKTSGRGTKLVLDLSGVRALDGTSAALLVELRALLARRGLLVSLTGANEHVAGLLSLYDTESASEVVEPRRPEGLVTQIGRITTAWIGELRDVIAFVGGMVVALYAVMRRRRAGHFGEVPHLVESAGSDAVPIVLLINFLVGFVMAYQAASQLIRFGANLYVADLVGLSMTRELAPLMTAIIICGRSGAAYAAEIGSMKVSDEVDALRTLGLRPLAWLAVPRILALVLVAPVLTLLADFVGVLGGLLVAVMSLEMTAYGYLLETQRAVVLWDVESGLIKSAAFGLAVGLIACQQGFAASGGAEGVGKRTTATVVISLFVLVLVDTAFTIVYRATGLLP